MAATVVNKELIETVCAALMKPDASLRGVSREMGIGFGTVQKISKLPVRAAENYRYMKRVKASGATPFRGRSASRLTRHSKVG